MYIDDFVGWSSQGSLQGSGQLHVQGTEDLPNPTPELDRVRCQMVLIPTPNRDNSHPACRRCVKRVTKAEMNFQRDWWYLLPSISYVCVLRWWSPREKNWNFRETVFNFIPTSHIRYGGHSDKNVRYREIVFHF